MRRKFAKDLYELMEKDDNVVLLTGDLGYGMLDAIKTSFPERFFNVNACEHTMVAMAVGMAMKGKIPVCYTITPFFFRAAEVIRNYLSHEGWAVKLVGSGRDKDYEDGGFSHDASDHERLLFPNIEMYLDYNNLEEIIYNNKPTYLNLKR